MKVKESLRSERDRLLAGRRQGRYLHSRYGKRIQEITRQLDEAEEKPGFDIYTTRVLDFLSEHADGVPTDELRAAFPRAQLRRMEKDDKTICYENHRWHVVQRDDS